MSTISFSSPTYNTTEGVGLLQIGVTRSGATGQQAIVLVGTDRLTGTAQGEYNKIYNDTLVTDWL